MISSLNSENYYLHKNHRLQPQPYKPPHEHRDTGSGKSSFHTKQKYPRHLLAYSIITILVYLCWLPDFIVALKDVSVTIPQAVKRGSNAMLTCNYDMENDTLYSVKWYKGRREFYRYTPKENPAMKVFPSQSGLNVERNLSNQSHVVLLAVPLNISGKFTCEISVEAPSFQTAMVSGEMEVVELPEEQATVTGIQPRYRIGDLVDGNCSIKYSKPAANLTWTINGIVVPPHHIKTYQIEKYEETNLESVMSAIHFMVTTQHFIKGQMRLKCTASIFDIFQNEIESIIEEDRPRIMASGQSYPPDHGYDPHGDSDGYEHNESYLTYFSAPKSSASRSTECILTKLFNCLKQKTFALYDVKSYVLRSQLTTTLANNMKNYFHQINQYDISSTYSQFKQYVLGKYITSVMVILLMAGMLRKIVRKIFQMIITFTLTAEEPVTLNCTESIKEVIRQTKYNFQVISLWHKKQYRLKRKEPQRESAISYQNANNDDCQAKCDQLLEQQDKHCIVVANQNVFNESFSSKDTNITTIEKNKNETIAVRTLTAIEYQHQMTETLAVARLLSPYKCIHTMLPSFTSSLPDSSSFSSFPFWSLSSSSSSSASASASSLLPSLLSSTIWADRKTHAHDSFPLYTLGASKSNNAKYMSKDQTLLMTSTLTAAMTSTTLLLASLSTCATSSALALLISPKHCTNKTSLSLSSPLTSSASASASASASVGALVLESKLLETSVVYSLEISKFSPLSLSFPLTLFFAGNNYLMAFIGELLLHQC